MLGGGQRNAGNEAKAWAAQEKKERENRARVQEKELNWLKTHVENQNPPHQPGERVRADLPSFKKIVKLEKAGVDTDAHSQAEAAWEKLKLEETKKAAKEKELDEYVKDAHAKLSEEAKREPRAVQGPSGHKETEMKPHESSVAEAKSNAVELAKKVPYKVSWEGGEDKEVTVTLEELKKFDGKNYVGLTSDEVNELYNLDQFKESEFDGRVYVDDPVPTDCNIVGGYNTNTNDNPVWNYMVDCDPIINTTGRSGEGNIKKGVKNVYSIPGKDGEEENKWLERQKEGARLRKRNLSKPDLSKLEEGTLILVDQGREERLGKYIKSERQYYGFKKHYIHFLGEKVETINKSSNWSAEIDEIQKYVRENGSKLGEIENYKYVELE